MANLFGLSFIKNINFSEVNENEIKTENNVVLNILDRNQNRSDLLKNLNKQLDYNLQIIGNKDNILFPEVLGFKLENNKFILPNNTNISSLNGFTKFNFYYPIIKLNNKKLLIIYHLINTREKFSTDLKDITTEKLKKDAEEKVKLQFMEIFHIKEIQFYSNSKLNVYSYFIM
jgi:hypothetical protein